MMKTSWHFERTLFPSLYIAKLNETQLEKANKLFAKKEFIRASYGTLQAIDPTICTAYGNKKQDRFSIPHLYTIIDITLGKNEWTIQAQLPALLPQKAGSQLAQLLRESFSALTVTAVYLEGNQPLIRYTGKPEDTAPEKLHEVLRETAMFIQQYQLQFTHIPIAEHIQEMSQSIASVPNPETTWATVLHYIDEGLAKDTEHISSASWYVVINSLYKITHYCAPLGETGRLLEKAKYNMTHTGEITEQINTGKEALKKIKKGGPSRFLQDLPPLTVVLPSKETSALFHMQSEFFEFFQLLGEMMSEKEYDNLVQTATLRLLGIMDANSIPASIYNFLDNALHAASGQSWPQAAAILYQAVDQLCNHYNVALLAADFDNAG